MATFDYIVVGAGTAGCVLAARLSEDPAASVLLLEAGGPARTRAMTVPNAWPENLGSQAEWGDVTTPQADAGSGIYPRGKALGGSGAINAMAHVRGHRAVYDRWAADGASGWAFADLLPYFLRSERADGRDPALRGSTGAVRVAPAAADGRHPAAQALAAALADSGHPLTGDLSTGSQEGVAWIDLAIADGERVSSADAYLRPAALRANLTVATDCLATRLTVRDGRCAGVSYLRDGQLAEARAASEVIVCAGAIGSPQLLLLSGIGPARELRELGIDPVADVAAVGRNLQDHSIALLGCEPPVPLPVSSYNHGEVCAALRSDLAGAYPDLHLFTILLPVPPSGFTAAEAGFNLAASAVAPDSRGSVRLAAADPQTAPLIDPGFLRDPRDLDRLTAGLELLRELTASPRFAPVIKAELWPGPQVKTREDLRGYIRRTVSSYYHPAGTCRAGSGADAVVDPQLRVAGVAGLRIADASVMPVITNAHPNATVLAIAERAAELVRGDQAGPR